MSFSLVNFTEQTQEQFAINSFSESFGDFVVGTFNVSHLTEIESFGSSCFSIISSLGETLLQKISSYFPPHPQCVTPSDVFIVYSWVHRSPSSKETPHTSDNTAIIRERLNACPAAHALLQKVKKIYGKHIHLSILPQSQIKWPAQCDTTHGSIEIAEELSPEKKLSAVVFELGNLSQKDKFYQLHQKVKQRKISREALVYQTEELEYETSQIHNRVVEQCRSIPGWDEIPLYDYRSFIESLLSSEGNGHADKIRERYDQWKKSHPFSWTDGSPLRWRSFLDYFESNFKDPLFKEWKTVTKNFQASMEKSSKALDDLLKRSKRRFS